jgi:hypothetical protein
MKNTILLHNLLQQKRDLDRDTVKQEEKNNRNFCQYIFESMIKVIDFILSKYEIEE